MVGIYSFKLSLSMMKVLMKKILFKKKNLHRLYKIHNTFYNTVVLQNIISCQGEQVKKKKGNVCSNPQSVYFDRLSSSFSYPTYLAV